MLRITNIKIYNDISNEDLLEIVLKKFKIKKDKSINFKWFVL